MAQSSVSGYVGPQMDILAMFPIPLIYLRFEVWFQIDQNQGKIMAELKLHTWAFTMR